MKEIRTFSHKSCCEQLRLGKVVAQLVEWMLPTPENHGSNPAVDINLFAKFYQPDVKKTKIKKKEAEKGRAIFSKALNIASLKLHVT